MWQAHAAPQVLRPCAHRGLPAWQTSAEGASHAPPVTDQQPGYVELEEQIFSRVRTTQPVDWRSTSQSGPPSRTSTTAPMR
eukprot:6989377-Pyramimonas_sp.AAC.1